jgi:phosphoribosylglycinamide formyltransferase-1
MDGRIAVLASGHGTNVQALLDDPDVGSHVALVVSDRAEAFALERARRREVPTVHLDPASFADRAAHDEALVALLREHAIDIVVLAGYLRLVGPTVVETFADRLVNVHPALLPSFPGTHAVEDALAYRVKVTGVTVHLVDEGIDTGPVLLQESLEVLDDDDWDSLEARVHAIEHRLLPQAVRALLEGRVRRRGRLVWIEGVDEGAVAR